jgi:hypothetical protein
MREKSNCMDLSLLLCRTRVGKCHGINKFMHAPQSEPATVGPKHPPLSIHCFLYDIITARGEFAVVNYEDG